MFDVNPVRDAVAAFLPELADYQLSYFRNTEILQGYLKGPKELVSQVDITSEHMIRHHLGQIIPEAAFYGEEIEQEIGEEFTWVVDPIDGTVNYVSGLTEWAISIALLYRKEPLLGIVYKPSDGELYSAVRGEGAFLHDQRLPLLPFHGSLNDAVIATAFPFRSPDSSGSFYSMAEELLPRCREIRRLGSIALDLSYTAAGFLQGYWEADIKLYDIAAALLILSEAEVAVRDFYGNPFELLKSNSLCAAHANIADELTDFTSLHYAAHAAHLTHKEQ